MEREAQQSPASSSAANSSNSAGFEARTNYPLAPVPEEPVAADPAAVPVPEFELMEFTVKTEVPVSPPASGRMDFQLAGIDASARVRTSPDSQDWKLGFMQSIDGAEWVAEYARGRKVLRIEDSVNDSQRAEFHPWGRKDGFSYKDGRDEELGGTVGITWSDHPHWFLPFHHDRFGRLRKVSTAGVWTLSVVVLKGGVYTALGTKIWGFELSEERDEKGGISNGIGRIRVLDTEAALPANVLGETIANRDLRDQDIPNPEANPAAEAPAASAAAAAATSVPVTSAPSHPSPRTQEEV